MCDFLSTLFLIPVHSSCALFALHYIVSFAFQSCYVHIYIIIVYDSQKFHKNTLLVYSCYAKK